MRYLNYTELISSIKRTKNHLKRTNFVHSQSINLKLKG